MRSATFVRLFASLSLLSYRQYKFVRLKCISMMNFTCDRCTDSYINSKNEIHILAYMNLYSARTHFLDKLKYHYYFITFHLQKHLCAKRHLSTQFLTQKRGSNHPYSPRFSHSCLRTRSKLPPFLNCGIISWLICNKFYAIVSKQAEKYLHPGKFYFRGWRKQFHTKFLRQAFEWIIS